MPDKAQFTIPTDGSPLAFLELQATLSFVRGLYKVFLDAGAADLNTEDTRPSSSQVAYVLSRMPEEHLTFEYFLSRSFESIDLDDELYVEHLQRTNPIDLYLIGLAVPLTFAVILSGGKLQVGPLKVELPPIGRGIMELRKALTARVQLRARELKSASRKVASHPLPPRRL